MVSLWRVDDQCEVFAIRLRFLVVLTLAVVGLVASIVVPAIVRSIRAQDARADLAAANAAFRRPRVPSDFLPYPPANAVVCPAGLCYYVAKPTAAISKSTLLGVLRSFGAQYDAAPSGCDRIRDARPPGPRTLTSCAVYARLDGLYTYAYDARYVLCEPRCRWTADSYVVVAPPFTPPNT